MSFCLTHLEHPVGSPEHFSFRFPAIHQNLRQRSCYKPRTAFVTGSMSLDAIISIESGAVSWVIDVVEDSIVVGEGRGNRKLAIAPNVLACHFY